MILVTGATGNIGKPLLQYLSISPTTATIRALTRDPATVQLPSGVEAARGSLTDLPSVRAALVGARALFLVSRIGDDTAIIDAARDAGVEHIVLVSSITVQTHPHLGPAQSNAAVERYLEASGLSWTILRPTQVASNSLMWSPDIQSQTALRVPFADAQLPTIDPSDIGAVAHVALTDPSHHGEHLALTGPEPISARQQIENLSRLLGRDIELIEVSREEARRSLVAVFGESDVDAVLDVTGGALNDEITQVRDTVERVTGIPARTFRDWAERNISLFR